MPSHCLLASYVFDEKSGIPSMWLVIFLLLLSRFFLWLSSCNYDVLRCGSLCVFYLWRSLTFLTMWISIYYQIWEVLRYYSSNIFCYFLFFPSFRDSHSAYVGILGGVAQVLQALFMFSCSFIFLCPRVDNLNWPMLKLTRSFFCQFKCTIESLWWICHSY